MFILAQILPSRQELLLPFRVWQFSTRMILVISIHVEGCIILNRFKSKVLGYLDLEFIILLDLDFNCEIILCWNWNSNLNWVVIYFNTSKFFYYIINFLKLSLWQFSFGQILWNKLWWCWVHVFPPPKKKKKHRLCYQFFFCIFNSMN
jgi:hypothetical protein